MRVRTLGSLWGRHGAPRSFTALCATRVSHLSSHVRSGRVPAIGAPSREKVTVGEGTPRRQRRIRSRAPIAPELTT